MTNTELNLAADMIEVSEIIERFEELETELLDCFNEQQEIEGFTVSDDSEEVYEAKDADDALFVHWLSDCRLEEAGEYHALKALLDELKGNGGDEHWRGDWYPQYLIAESYFTDYIEELIDDCYEMPKEMNSGVWPYRHVTIDYEAAADEAKGDYCEIEIEGVTYFYR